MSSRCQHSGPRGQCSHPSVDGSDFCKTHSNEDSRIRGYLLENPELKARFVHHSADSESLETVRQEVRLLRTLIDDRINLAQTPAERINAFSVIHPAISTLNKLVESLNKMERQADIVLGKSALLKLSDDIVTILIEELAGIPDYTDIIDRVAERIAGAIADAHNEEK